MPSRGRRLHLDILPCSPFLVLIAPKNGDNKDCRPRLPQSRHRHLETHTRFPRLKSLIQHYVGTKQRPLLILKLRNSQIFTEAFAPAGNSDRERIQCHLPGVDLDTELAKSGPEKVLLSAESSWRTCPTCAGVAASRCPTAPAAHRDTPRTVPTDIST